MYVFDSTTNLPKTGDAANLTAYRSLDYAASATVLGDTSATEVDATNAKGYYQFDLTQGETNGDQILFTCKSSTANMVALCMPAVVFTTPNRFTTMVVDAAGLVDANTVKVGPTGAGTAQTAGDIITAISGIGTSGGAAIPVDATTDNASGGITGVTSGTTKVGTETGTFANTSNVNGTYHVITHAANAIDWVYQFLTGGGTSPVGAVWTGYLTSSNDIITFYAWDHVGAAWESIGTQIGQTGTVNVVKNLVLYARHRGTSAAELGKVYIRLACTAMTSPVLNTDQLYVSYSVTSRSVGYADGAVWVDTVGGVAGTESYVNGTADNPVSTWANALTIAAAVGIKRFRIIAGSTITLTADSSKYAIIGDGLYTLALGGQTISNAFFDHAYVTGTGDGSDVIFNDCSIAAGTSLPPCFLVRCSFAGTVGSPVTAASAGQFAIVDGVSLVAGSGTPYFTFAGACGVNFRRWSGGSNITLDNATSTITMEVVTGGGQTIATGGAASVEIRGTTRSITLTGIASTSSVQINCVTGPISLAGADGTVNVYGVSGTITDSRTGTPLGTVATVLNKINLATPTNITAGTITTVGTLTGHTPQTGDSFARIGAAGAGLTAVAWNAAWDAEVQSEVQDALDTTLADSVPADGSRPTLAQAVYMINQFLMERAVSSTTVTVKKVDGSTSLMTFTLNDATSPTSITRAT